MLAFRVPSTLKVRDLDFAMLACTEVVGVFPPQFTLFYSTCIPWCKRLLKSCFYKKEITRHRGSMIDIRKHPYFQILNYNHLTMPPGAAALFSMLLPQNALHSGMVIMVLITQVGV